MIGYSGLATGRWRIKWRSCAAGTAGRGSSGEQLCEGWQNHARCSEAQLACVFIVKVQRLLTYFPAWKRGPCAVGSAQGVMLLQVAFQIVQGGELVTLGRADVFVSGHVLHLA